MDEGSRSALRAQGELACSFHAATLATEEQLRRNAQAWREWAESPDALYARSQAEALGSVEQARTGATGMPLSSGVTAATLRPR